MVCRRLKLIMTTNQTQPVRHSHYGIAALIAILLIGILASGYYGYAIYKKDRATLESEIGTLNVQMDALKEQMKNQSQIVFTNINLTQLYDKIKSSVVMIRGFVVQTSFFTQTTTEVQGSGFVYNYTYTGRMVVVTNYHVVDGVSDISVTFMNGTAYSATVLGKDVYVDLAVLEVNAPVREFKPLPIIDSSTLNVGDPVIAIGNPFGLTGSMTTGTVSQLGRTIRESTTGGYAIANIIQFDAPINPGNSGGPLLNSKGQVVGITTAIVQNSQGLGFAIPSNAILREIAWLIESGTYTGHSWLGVQGIDMNYYIAREMNINITYGWLITNIISGGPAEAAGLRGGTREVQIGGNTVAIGGDIIVAMNGTSIINGDALSAYLEERTRPDTNIRLTIKRDGTSTPLNVYLKLGTRP